MAPAGPPLRFTTANSSDNPDRVWSLFVPEVTPIVGDQQAAGLPVVPARRRAGQDLFQLRDPWECSAGPAAAYLLPSWFGGGGGLQGGTRTSDRDSWTIAAAALPALAVLPDVISEGGRLTLSKVDLDLGHSLSLKRLGRPDTRCLEQIFAEIARVSPSPAIWCCRSRPWPLLDGDQPAALGRPCATARSSPGFLPIALRRLRDQNRQHR